ncbi:hypothetical protein LXL04_003162 [Taraxacum kok-saghyz]
MQNEQTNIRYAYKLSTESMEISSSATRQQLQPVQNTEPPIVNHRDSETTTIQGFVYSAFILQEEQGKVIEYVMDLHSQNMAAYVALDYAIRKPWTKPTYFAKTPLALGYEFNYNESMGNYPTCWFK